MGASTRTTRSRASNATKDLAKPQLNGTSINSPMPKKRKLSVTGKLEDDGRATKKGPKSGTGNKTKGPTGTDAQAGAQLAQSTTSSTETAFDSPSKKTKYNLSPGVSPYSSYPHPTPQECEEVNRILGKVHGAVSAPKEIPAPSLDSSGCGEVPSVLDALVRTRLSANTSNLNSNRAFKGLVERFGIIKEGIGKGSVDWNHVRRTDVKDLFEAIKSGGLAGVKSNDIKSILEMVYEENKFQRQKNGLKEDKEYPLSLDHLHGMSNEAAFDKLIRYPGIGPKTASCVLLFCMQRPSFAVDTHVFRLTRWLGWLPTDQQVRGMAKKGLVPAQSKVKKENADDSIVETSPNGKKVRVPPVSRETAYSHLDVRVPNHLKYPLHYLIIRHGKTCGWCSAKAGAAAKVGTCPLAHLMTGKGRNKGLAKTKVEDDDEDEQESDSEDEEY